jgi:hypothetical protein
MRNQLEEDQETASEARSAAKPRGGPQANAAKRLPTTFRR